ncbi:hypothetical protein QFC20_000968 [Naganishia adeliensis]|uniref:Uncharacterized protein n=1 Tax=Naganishia adeliensis TaxID=92952 RepID=A0ACC2WW55_9TREE|nr:hypothetical protein QFC20_000968 [Naganishia adeliensis]
MFRSALRRQLAQTQRRSASTSAGGSSQPEMSPQVKAAVESATKAYESAVGGVKRVAGPVGDSVGRLLGGYREPLVYNWKVFTSLCRQVYIAEKLAPPTSLSTWIHAYAKIWSRATSPAYYRQIAQSGEWSKVAVYVSHILGVRVGVRRGSQRRDHGSHWGEAQDGEEGDVMVNTEAVPGAAREGTLNAVQLGLEAYGIFKIGEIIGRRNIVGYKLEE